MVGRAQIGVEEFLAGGLFPTSGGFDGDENRVDGLHQFRIIEGRNGLNPKCLE